ncbi:hypothetical protein WOLCODRAFT_136644 [Wolfiporia cocos MD-104 SS10]|uniref:Uncharacterized protein n=1 Tax=Wolfiporia cocos (strain MD-104) TaxID=742152 RepID=A0A2H3JDW6_WOLCO|nr:hypothetical protein WOLCODRAFT_136644 [Wolfiporia cocos MD-104 SS10]
MGEGRIWQGYLRYETRKEEGKLEEMGGGCGSGRAGKLYPAMGMRLVHMHDRSDGLVTGLMRGKRSLRTIMQDKAATDIRLGPVMHRLYRARVILRGDKGRCGLPTVHRPGGCYSADKQLRCRRQERVISVEHAERPLQRHWHSVFARSEGEGRSATPLVNGAANRRASGLAADFWPAKRVERRGEPSAAAGWGGGAGAESLVSEAERNEPHAVDIPSSAAARRVRR